MAKRKTRRTAGRTAAGSKRAAGPARSKKSRKVLKKRAARKAAPKRRRAAATRTTTARASRSRRPLKRAKAALPATRRSARGTAKSVKRVASRSVKKVGKKVVATPVKTVVARSVTKASKPIKKVIARSPVPPRPRTAAPAPVVVTAAAGAAPTAPAAAPIAAPQAARAPRRAAAVVHGKAPALDRERRRLPEADVVPSPPSSLDLNRSPSAARSGQAGIAEHLAEHNESSPELTAGDVDANWESAYSTGDEAPGGDNPTPDQDVVDDIGRSLGLTYEDNEELKGADKITERDKHRWELDPASSEDFEDR